MVTGAYDRAVVSYIDVLGFADLINESVADPSKVTKISSLLLNMKEELSAGGRIHRDAKERVVKIFASFNFSDLIVRSTKIPDGADISSIIDWELFYLGSKQFDLAIDGVLVRGGMSLGDLLISREDSIVFGPALVRAYKLESQNAVYPRIVIDRDIITTAEDGGFIAEWGDYLGRGEDGAYFLDYLFGTVLTGFVVPDAPDPKEQIAAHRRMIERVIANGIRQKPERIRQKYLWLALYHNATLKRLRERLGNRMSGASEIPDNLLNF